MIGGRVLDASAVVAFAEQRSVYASALVWTAVEEDVVLLVPAAVLVAVEQGLDPRDGAARAVLEVLLGLPVTVVESLDAAAARSVGELAGAHGLDVASAHAARTALDRGWAVVTAAPDRYAAVPGLEVESL